MASDSDMSKAAFRISFDGDALTAHTMDVRDLAPSLLGLAEVFIEANRLLNGKEAALQINVTPNIEEHCFDIGLEVVQQWEAIKKLLGDTDVVAAKALIDWILVGTTVVGAPLSLLLLYKKLRGKRPVNIILFNDENGNPLYRYQFDGEDDQILDGKQHKLYDSNKIRSQLARLLRPIIQREGVDEFIAYREGSKETGTRITKREASEIDFTISEPETDEVPEAGDTIDATLRVYSPVYDLSAPRWRFWFGKEHHYMDVTESNIREFVIQNGGALIDDRFRVRLELIEHESESGEITIDYKVKEVLDFIPAYRQASLFSGSQNIGSPDGGEID